MTFSYKDNLNSEVDIPGSSRTNPNLISSCNTNRYPYHFLHISSSSKNSLRPVIQALGYSEFISNRSISQIATNIINNTGSNENQEFSFLIRSSFRLKQVSNNRNIA